MTGKSLQDIFIGATEETKGALRFYENNYSCIGNWILEPGKKVTLTSSQPGVCRFCSLAHPSVTFRKEAHAIPECLGNKSLFTKYECDACNQFFGDGIETSLGIWSKPQRALSGVRGKRGVPKLKEESSRQWRFEHDSTGIKITQDETCPIAVVNEATKEITLTVHRDPYTPVAVLKAFTKMAIALLPEEELPNFRAAMTWIRNADHQIGLVKTSFFSDPLYIRSWKQPPCRLSDLASAAARHIAGPICNRCSHLRKRSVSDSFTELGT